MIELEKLGYFLMGTGFGMAASAFAYSHEMRKPIGDIEEHEFASFDESDDEDPTPVFDGTSIYISDGTTIPPVFANMANEMRKKSTETKDSDKISYHSMYDNKKPSMSDIIESSKDSIVTDDILEDAPSDDLMEESVDYVTERVEDNIEVYLDENPQDFVTLIFYQGYETLCDDREQLISNPEEVVGSVALERLVTGGPGAEDGSIFVRNLKTMINYEIVLDAGSYSETVLGIFEANLDKEDGGDVDS